MGKVQESTTESSENRTNKERLVSKKVSENANIVNSEYAPQEVDQSFFEKSSLEKSNQFQTQCSYPQKEVSNKQQVHNLRHGDLNIDTLHETSQTSDLPNQALFPNAAPLGFIAANKINPYRNSFSETSGSTSYSTADDASVMGVADEIELGYNIYNAYHYNLYSDSNVPLIYQNQTEVIQNTEKEMKPVEANNGSTRNANSSVMPKNTSNFKKLFFSDQVLETNSITASIMSSSSILIDPRVQFQSQRFPSSLRTGTSSFSQNPKRNNQRNFTKHFNAVSSQADIENGQNKRLEQQYEIAQMQELYYNKVNTNFDYSEQHITNPVNSQRSNYQTTYVTGDEPNQCWYKNQVGNENKRRNFCENSENKLNTVHNKNTDLKFLDDNGKYGNTNDNSLSFPSNEKTYEQISKTNDEDIAPDSYTKDNKALFTAGKLMGEHDTCENSNVQNYENLEEGPLLRNYQNNPTGLYGPAATLDASESVPFFHSSTQYDVVSVDGPRDVQTGILEAKVFHKHLSYAMQRNNLEPNAQSYSASAPISIMQPYKNNKQAMLAAEGFALRNSNNVAHATTQPREPFTQHLSFPKNMQGFSSEQNYGRNTPVNQCVETRYSNEPNCGNQNFGVNPHSQSKLLPPISMASSLQNTDMGNNHGPDNIFGKKVNDMTASQYIKVQTKKSSSKNAKVRGRKPTNKGADSLMCPYCKDENACSFKRKEHLKRHISSVHIKKKPFQCPKCGKKFTRVDNMKNHVNICKN